MRSERSAPWAMLQRELVPFKASTPCGELKRYSGGSGQKFVLMPRDVYALARLVPVEVDSRVSDAPKKHVAISELRRSAFQAFFELLARIRDRRPLVVYIDDLHWLDVDSALLFQHLLEAAAGRPALGDDRWEPCPMLFVTSYRSEAQSANRLLTDVVQAARDIDRLTVHELRLGPLEPEATRHLAQQLLGETSSALAERIAFEAQGSPFFARELAHRAAFTNQPFLTLQEALAAHVAPLSSTARNLLEVVAIAGRPIQERIATDATATDTPR